MPYEQYRVMVAAVNHAHEEVHKEEKQQKTKEAKKKGTISFKVTN